MEPSCSLQLSEDLKSSASGVSCARSRMGTVKPTKLYLITDINGYTPQIGRLVSMMNYVRWTTLEEVEDLNVEQLDYLHDEDSNSIGALLMHIAAVEASYQKSTLDLDSFKGRDSKELRIAVDLGKRARRRIKGHGLDHYLRILEAVRSKTLGRVCQERRRMAR